VPAYNALQGQTGTQIGSRSNVSHFGPAWSIHFGPIFVANANKGRAAHIRFFQEAQRGEIFFVAPTPIQELFTKEPTS
jgi:hypothetical protein